MRKPKSEWFRGKYLEDQMVSSLEAETGVVLSGDSGVMYEENLPASSELEELWHLPTDDHPLHAEEVLDPYLKSQAEET